VSSRFRNLLPLHWRWLVPVAVLIAGFHFVPGGATLDRAFLDFSSRHPLRDPPPPDGSALVLVDRATMDELGREPYAMRWPFPRAAFAALILALHQAGAQPIVVDYIFLDQSDAAEQDLLLGAIAAAAGPTVLARTPKQAPVIWDDAFRRQHAAFFPSARLGNVEFLADPDGVVRHYRAPGSLAAAAFDPPATAPGGLVRWYGGLAQVSARGVPVLSAGQFIKAGLLIFGRVSAQAPNFTPEEISRALATEPELTGETAAAVRGRTVFVGANAEGTFDVKPLPVGGSVEPGVLIHWTVWANLKGHGFILEVPRWVALTGGLLVAVLIGFFGRRHRSLVAPGLAAGGLAVLCLAGAYAAHSAGWFFPPATPVAGALFALLGVTAESFLVERQRKREIQAIFGSYVAPEVVTMLVRDPAAIRLGGERRELTALFSDLAGFTDLSEKIPPEQLLAVVNLYLQEVSDCLLANGAYIDKYIGDAVMAVFGAPQSLTDHAAAACEGALAAQRVLAGLNPRFERDYGCTLRMRIGINTGDMIVGNMGSERKRNYTVLGDAVNLASRLEAANKEFGTSILLGETTARRVQDRFATRPLTRLRVKGKTEAVEVHELVGAAGALTGAQQSFLDAYNAGYAALTSQRFSEAAASFARAQSLAPDDLMARAWHKEAAAYTVDPPPSDWQPLLKLTSK
jgi:adenylate cyclase